MKKVFRVEPDLNAQSTYQLKVGDVTMAAAPFDTPSHVVLSTKDRMLIAEFLYVLGENERPVIERLENGIVAYLGELSGRVMRLEISSEAYESNLNVIAKDLKTRERNLASTAAVGQPLRKAAHYGLVGTRVLPAMNSYIAAELLPELRRITNH